VNSKKQLPERYRLSVSEMADITDRLSAERMIHFREFFYKGVEEGFQLAKTLRFEDILSILCWTDLSGIRNYKPDDYFMNQNLVDGSGNGSFRLNLKGKTFAEGLKKGVNIFWNQVKCDV
jgi:hypothetical protein